MYEGFVVCFGDVFGVSPRGHVLLCTLWLFWCVSSCYLFTTVCSLCFGTRLDMLVLYFGVSWARFDVQSLSFSGFNFWWLGRISVGTPFFVITVRISRFPWISYV
ncbi:hypothetical protein B0T16DRAFT_422439 [Cercophora newfieldiana]|uniref:Transmembrane protein n=1 Tax=Cercophora newfieldiana TaxID=92897 RepID=A0AA40CJ70_9PEZI|nr:hypothetical protein B0T16DRAFT_422439 [Cercophora newfieldiana]